MRTARIIQPGVFYHVTSRVNHKEMLLRSPVAKELFLEQLVRLRLRHICEILDFVVMENHVHLILRPVGEAQRDSPSDLDSILDPLHSDDEMRYILIGVSIALRLLVVVHTDRGDKVRIISARKANAKEARYHVDNRR